MNGLLRKKIDISFLKKIDTRFGDSALWQFVKFVTAKLPPVLRPVFRPEALFEGHSPYVVDGVVTWGYVLPFFLSNFIANLYGYFMNMKTTFRGKGSRSGLVTYLMILSLLILFSTWLQGWITARTIAAAAAGLVQVAVLFPLEKYVLFKKE